MDDNLLQTLHEEMLDYSITKVNIPESACIIGNNEKAYFLAGNLLISSFYYNVYND